MKIQRIFSVVLLFLAISVVPSAVEAKFRFHGGIGAGGPPAYTGPCDAITCAEAYSMDRAMLAAYSGPLFQVVLASNHSLTMDIPQTTSRTADLSGLAAFGCSTPANCLVGKVYAQIHGSANDRVPSVFNAPFGPNCSIGDAYFCASSLEVDAGLPHMKGGYNRGATPSPEYTLAADASAAGLTGGTGPMSVYAVGTTLAVTLACCGYDGITHKYNAGDVTGTEFQLLIAYDGATFSTPCTSTTNFCAGFDFEGGPVGDPGFFEFASAIQSVIQVGTFGGGLANLWINGHQLITNAAVSGINTGTSIHLFGGGDLSQVAAFDFREDIFTNTVLSSGQIAMLTANAEVFYSGLTFP
jgi:hypothetical protein